MTTTPTHPGFSNILSDNVHGDYVLATCGSTVGKLFFNKLKNCTGKLGSVSCILKADNFWCSPSELESLGGKAKVKTGRDPSVLMVNHYYTALFIWDLVTQVELLNHFCNHSPPACLISSS